MGMPLIMSTPGQQATVAQITGKNEVRRRLEELGFVIGGNVAVVSEIGGNLIVQVKDGRVALDKTMASRIIVD